MSSILKPKPTLRDHVVASMIVFFGLVMVAIVFYFVLMPCGEFIIDQVETEMSNASYVIQ